MFYVAIIESGSRGDYGVFFPDIPGCTSHGSSVQEAAENAADALSLYLEGSDERPQPTDIASIAVDPDIDVVARVLVPAPDAEGPIARYNVTLPSGLVKRIDRRVGGRQRSAFLADAARRMLARD
jgi:predicted RNase H-like HicB family nuclease